MSRIEYLTAKGAKEETHGSDTRLNVSSRIDSRSFYVSRDAGQSYVVVGEDDDAAVNDLIFYLQNTSPSLHLFLRDIDVTTELATTIKVFLGDATIATGGSVLTPTNLNRSKSSNAAAVTCRGSGAIGGVAASTLLGIGRTDADGEAHFEFNDSLILGQNDNIVVEYDTASGNGDVEVTCHFYMDTLQ